MAAVRTLLQRNTGPDTSHFQITTLFKRSTPTSGVCGESLRRPSRTLECMNQLSCISFTLANTHTHTHTHTQIHMHSHMDTHTWTHTHTHFLHLSGYSVQHSSICSLKSDWRWIFLFPHDRMELGIKPATLQDEEEQILHTVCVCVGVHERARVGVCVHFDRNILAAARKGCY